MTDEQRRRWFALRAKSDTLLDRPVAPAPPRNPLAEDALERWQRNMPTAEPPPPPPPRKLDTVTMGSVRALIAEAVDAERESEREWQHELLAELLAHIQREYADAIDEKITQAVALLSRDLGGIADAVRDETERRRAASANKHRTTDNVTTMLPRRPGIQRRA